MSAPSFPEGFNSSSSFEFNSALGELNNEAPDINAVNTFDPAEQSYLSLVRNTLSQLYKTKTIPKNEYLGVVLKIEDEQDDLSQRFFKRIYVNVPTKDVEGIENQDDLDPSSDTTSIEHKVFYPASEKIEREQLPHVGAVVRVQLAKDYFSRSISNPRDNKYLGLYGYSVFLAPKKPGEVPNAKQRTSQAQENFNKKTLQDSLFTNKPEKAVDEKYFVQLPYKGSFLITSMPAVRKPPPNSRGASQGLSAQGHYALDIGMPEGTPIYAVTEHEIIKTSFDTGGFGNYVKAKNDKYLYFYGHLKQKIALSGTVKSGELIGYSGNTGGSQAPHLHFEIRDLNNNNKLNPLFFIKGKITLNDSMKSKFDFNTNSLDLPWPTTATTENIGVIIPAPEPKAEVPTAKTPSPTATSTNGAPASAPTTRPKLLLTNFSVDLANQNIQSSKRGTKSIKIREDIYSDLLKIKSVTDTYNCNFSFSGIDVKLSNPNLSHLARVGLEVHLNENAGLSLSSNLEFDDYFIGPNYNFPIGNGYKLNVYIAAKRTVKIFNLLYDLENKVTDIYDIKETYLKEKPKIIKIFKPYLNLTKIFEDFGFIQMPPAQKFFQISDYKVSNWNIFYKPNKIIKGYSYKELLETVYDKNNDVIWKQKDAFWNGSKFT